MNLEISQILACQIKFKKIQSYNFRDAKQNFSQKVINVSQKVGMQQNQALGMLPSHQLGL